MSEPYDIESLFSPVPLQKHLAEGFQQLRNTLFGCPDDLDLGTVEDADESIKEV